jgi:hypothetical protein
MDALHLEVRRIFGMPLCYLDNGEYSALPQMGLGPHKVYLKDECKMHMQLIEARKIYAMQYCTTLYVILSRNSVGEVGVSSLSDVQIYYCPGKLK